MDCVALHAGLAKKLTLNTWIVLLCMDLPAAAGVA